MFKFFLLKRKPPKIKKHFLIVDSCGVLDIIWVGFSVSVTILAEMGQFSFLSVRYDSFLLGFSFFSFFFQDQGV
jgi:hypothetical protein